MKFKTIIRHIRNGHLILMLKLLKMSNEFYKASFLSTAISQGIYDKFVNGKSSFEKLCENIGVSVNQEGLYAWLELGVRLGELKRVGFDWILTTWRANIANYNRPRRWTRISSIEHLVFYYRGIWPFTIS